MSYSISFKAPSKAIAKQMADDQISEVVKRDPVHVNDRDAALAALDQMMTVVGEPGELEELSVSLTGSLAGQWVNGSLTVITGAGVSVWVGISPKPVAHHSV